MKKSELKNLIKEVISEQMLRSKSGMASMKPPKPQMKGMGFKPPLRPAAGKDKMNMDIESFMANAEGQMNCYDFNISTFPIPCEECNNPTYMGTVNHADFGNPQMGIDHTFFCD